MIYTTSTASAQSTRQVSLVATRLRAAVLATPWMLAAGAGLLRGADTCSPATHGLLAGSMRDPRVESDFGHVLAVVTSSLWFPRACDQVRARYWPESGL